MGSRVDRFVSQTGLRLTEDASRVIGLSDFAAQVVRRQTEWFAEALADGAFARPADAAELRAEAHAIGEAAASINQLKRDLRRLRNRWQFKIVWRHLLNLADFTETTRALSDMADLLLDTALNAVYRWECERHGVPMGSESGAAQRLTVFGLGKLGGRELNLSSDIDLIFAFPEPGKTTRGMANQNFFVRVGQRLIDALGTVTEEGFVFRVDMRLRPHGDAGPLAMHFSALERYLETEGREWERYAYTKARACAGDLGAGADFLAGIRSFIFRRYLDFGAIEAMRDLKALLDGQREADDVKSGVGGIRDAEFSVQAHQLIRGGQEPGLRQPAFLDALAELERLEIFDRETAAHLREAYLFLRHSEHSIQAESDRQTQRLPANDLGRTRLALSMGFSRYEDYHAALAGHRARVEAIFDGLLVVDAPEVENDLWRHHDDPISLALAGFDDAPTAVRKLEELAKERDRASVSDTGRERLNAVMPRLLQMIVRSPKPMLRLERILPILRAVLRRSTYLALLRDQPAAMDRLVRLAGDSQWLAEQFRMRPMFLDLLQDTALPVLASPPAEREELVSALDAVAGEDLDEEALLDALRAFKERHVFQVVLAQALGALPLMLASDYLTFVAEAVLETTISRAWFHMARRDEEMAASGGRGFIAVGYGKLGGIELGPGSDLDLVFMHDLPTSAAPFTHRLVRKLLSYLTVPTYYGPLYEIDMRLRPSGNSGPLVATLEAFEQYQQQSAWVWEQQALVRARAVAGDPDLCRRFEKLRHDLLCQPRDPAEIRRRILEMRERMAEHLGKEDRLKQGVGGIVDIEFMVQYLVLANAHKAPEVARFSDNVRILESVGDAGVLDQDDADRLTWAYLALRAQQHRRMMDLGDHHVDEHVMASYRDTVSRVWEQLFKAPRNA